MDTASSDILNGAASSVVARVEPPPARTLGMPAGESSGDRTKDWTHNPDGNLTSLNPAAALAYLRLAEIVHYGEGPLSDVQRQMIATVVSARNHCVYWTLRHGRYARELAQDGSLTEHLVHDYSAAPISDADKAMLAFADKLTVQPSAMTEDDVKMLRGHGFTDRAILDIVLVAGMFNLTNRIVLGLGRDLHQGMDVDAARLGISDWRPASSREGLG